MNVMMFTSSGKASTELLLCHSEEIVITCCAVGAKDQNVEQNNDRNRCTCQNRGNNRGDFTVQVRSEWT